MKRILLIICVLFATSYTHAQQSINITNNTNCDIWYVLKGNTADNCAPSNYLSIAYYLPCCSTTHSYTDPADAALLPGLCNSSLVCLSAMHYFTGIWLYNTDPSSPSCDMYTKFLSNCTGSVSRNGTDECDTCCNDDCDWTASWTVTTIPSNVSIVIQ